MDSIILKVGGRSFEGWTDVLVGRSLSNVTGTFSLSVSNRFIDPFYGGELTLGKTCSIEINSQTILNGYIDDINIGYSGDGHNIEITGRDKTCDLVDCYLSPKQYNNQTISSLIKKICDVYGITINYDTGIRSVLDIKANNKISIFGRSETAYTKISELCKQVGVMATSYGDGRLVLTRSGLNGRSTDSLRSVFNVYACATQFSNKDRFSEYNVYGQAGNHQDTESVDSTAVKNTVPILDKVITRKRVFNREMDNADVASCNNWARFEKSFRAGMSRKINYTVVEWTQSDGSVWGINKKVLVDDKTLGISRDMLINDVEFSFSPSGGTLTKIGVVDLNTYSVVVTKMAETGYDLSELEETL